MPYVTIEDRVDRLEALFGQFLTEMALLNKRADERHKAAEERHKAADERHKAAEERHETAEERMANFQQEMAVLNRRAEERHETAEERMANFQKEMAVLNQRAEERHKAADERQARFEVEMRQSKRDLDKKWGDLANKMGTIIEDLVAPNLRRLAREHFRLEPVEDFMIRRSRRQPNRPEVGSEFDALVVGHEAVILGEAKSSPSLEYADAFADKVRVFFDFFPEYRGKRLIAVFGSWAIPDPVVERLTGLGIYALRMGEDTMELANAAALEAATAQPPH